MKVSSAILMTAIATQCSLAEDFYLKHEATGKMYGPYSTTQGAEVKIGKTVFIVAKPEKTESEAKASRMTEIRDVLNDLTAVKEGGQRGVYIGKAGNPDDMLIVTCASMGEVAEWKLAVTYSFTDNAKKTIKRLGIAIPDEWYGTEQEGLGISYKPQKSDVAEIAGVIYELLIKLYKIDLSEKLSFVREDYEM